MSNVNALLREAFSLINKCKGRHGVWASPHRYKAQCWTRDCCLIAAPVFIDNGPLYDPEIIRRHLSRLEYLQRSDGHIPTLFLDDEEAFITAKVKQIKQAGKMPFMLKAYLEGRLGDLTPNTRDSELMFLYGMAVARGELGYRVWGETITKCFEYIETIASPDDHLVRGADWRDTRDDLDDKPVLTNACILYYVLLAFSRTDKALEVKKVINERYFNGKFYVDYPGAEGNEAFDVLGNAMVIRFHIADDVRRESVLEYAVQVVAAPEYGGMRTYNVWVPPRTDEEREIMKRDGCAIYPFVDAYMMMTMLECGPRWHAYARKRFYKWCENAEGFYEWYDCVDGKGHGSPEQLWTAAMFVRLNDALAHYGQYGHQYW